MGVHEHKKSSKKHVSVGILTLSSSRTLENDESGLWIREQLIELGHSICFHEVIPDDAALISGALTRCLREHRPQLVIMTGGTGVSPKDVTIEAIRPLFDKELIAFAGLFAQLSYQQIGSAAILSRSTAGIIGTTAVFCIPGSLKACQLACQQLIFPEMGHLVKHISEN